MTVTWTMFARAAGRYLAGEVLRWASARRVGGSGAGGGAGDLVRFRLSAVEAAARQRRPGYVRAVLRSACLVRDGWLWLDRGDAARIGEAYRLGDGPSLRRRLVGLVAEVTVWLVAGGPLTPPQVLTAREVQCQTCPHRMTDADGRWIGCGLCGCRKIKLRMATAACPAGRWRAVRGVSAGAPRRG